ncbi:MAG: transcriptional regulator [Planctomycetota bacterium]
MNDQDFQSKLGELLTQIDTLPESEQPRLRQLAAETKDRHVRMKRTLSELQESLDQLRVTVKYLVFDLEATRRENTYLRGLLDTGDETQDN